jgi:NADH:ubiquinone oxidoreductase subunit B-like Fe-S oxidoreductase
MAVKGVNKFGWGQALGSVLLPGFVLACCAVVVIAVMASLGAAVGETFNSINQNLAP